MPSHAIITEDPRLNYVVVPKPEDEPEPEGCGLAPNTTMTQVDKYDYLIPLPKNPPNSHNEPLPLSFMQIKEGDVQSGIQWYKSHYPKLPDDLVEIMARYNFGDLKYATRKSIRNDAKKYKKKFQKNPGFTQGLIVKNQKHVVTFD